MAGGEVVLTDGESAPAAVKLDTDWESVIGVVLLLIIACLPVIIPKIRAAISGKEISEEVVGAKSLTWFGAGFSLLLTNLSLEQLHGQNQQSFQQGDMTPAQWESMAGLAMVSSAVLLIPVYSGWIRGSTNVSSIIDRVLGRNIRNMVDIFNCIFMLINGSFALNAGISNLVPMMFPNVEGDGYLEYNVLGGMVLSLSVYIATTGGTRGVAKSDILSGMGLFGLGGWLVYSCLADKDVIPQDLNRKTWVNTVKVTKFQDEWKDTTGKDPICQENEESEACIALKKAFKDEFDNYKNTILGKKIAKFNTTKAMTDKSTSIDFWVSRETFDESTAGEPTDSDFWPSQSGRKESLSVRTTHFFGVLVINIYYWWFNPAMALRVTSTRAPSHARRTILCVAFIKLVGFAFLCLPGLAIGSLVKGKKLIPGQSTEFDSGHKFTFTKSADVLAVLLSRYGDGLLKGLFTGILGMSTLSTMNSQINAMVETVVGPNQIGDWLKGATGLSALSSTQASKSSFHPKYLIAFISAACYLGLSNYVKANAEGDFFEMLQKTQSVPQVVIVICVASSILYVWTRGATIKDLDKKEGGWFVQSRSIVVGVIALGCMVLTVYTQKIADDNGKVGVPYVFPNEDNTDGVIDALTCYGGSAFIGVMLCFFLVNRRYCGPRCCFRSDKRIQGTVKNRVHKWYIMIGIAGILFLYFFQGVSFGPEDVDKENPLREIKIFLYAWFGLTCVMVALFVVEDFQEDESFCGPNKLVFNIDNDVLNSRGKAQVEKEFAKIVHQLGEHADSPTVIVQEDGLFTEFKYKAPALENRSVPTLQQMVTIALEKNKQTGLLNVRYGTQALWTNTVSDQVSEIEMWNAPDFDLLNGGQTMLSGNA